MTVLNKKVTNDEDIQVGDSVGCGFGVWLVGRSGGDDSPRGESGTRIYGGRGASR